MSTLPRISVVTPCLNMGRYIEDAIQSVQEQDYPNFEHVIIDAVSSDNTSEIVRRFPHVRFVSERDRGQSDGLNKGFRMATGDIVGWLNADEYYLPGALHAVAQGFQVHPEADVIYGDGIGVDEKGHVLRTKPAHRFNYNILLYYGCFIGTLNTFFKRTIFEEGLFIDVDYRVVMDFEYFVRLGSVGKVFSYFPSLLGAFRWTGQNASLQTDKRREERLRVQRTWSPMKLPDFGYDLLSEIYRAKRVSLKILNGNYRRELRIRSHSGEPTDWFRSYQARKGCETLINDYFGNSSHSQLSEVAKS
jgi:Glycosyltransferases involved in cell wall biogenesis